MIDYDKLKEAHELAEKYAEDNNETCTITQTYYGSSKHDYYKLNTYSYDELYFENLDELITKLKELTQPQPKYKVGQSVWVFSGECEIREAIILDDQSYINQYKIQFLNGFIGLYSENSLFTTKIELIQSQIDYWTKLKGENWLKEIDEALKDEKCQHESDGLYYSLSENMIISSKYLEGPITFDNAQYKCKKCGDYYR